MRAGSQSFATAVVTLCGIELAHRIRKRQFTMAHERNGEALSLKELWDRAISGVVRYARKVSFGHSLYLTISPKGGRYSRYRYRFQGRERMLAWGC